MDDIKAKQQIVEKIKDSTSILITVSNDPSVDALSAALGMTLLLDKLDKHPTSIFSGAVPPAISFLEPEKTFDSTTDSLRDFIIALDKSKADHLRYKVEGDSVKIFITPYKTTITSSDLDFSQGEINVELVIALGVDNQDHLDSALESHGQILHDATIITVTAGDQTSSLGGIDWHDDQASSLSEMVAGLAEALKTDKTKSLLDASIATTLLTGIVAQTDRFSNTHTTSRVMTVAAQLMGAGADQQLIASKLEETHEIGASASPKPEKKNDDLGTLDVQDDEDDSKGLNISLKPNETLEELDKRVKAAEQAEAAEVADEALAEQVKETEPAPEDNSGNLSHAYAVQPETVVESESAAAASEPSLGGTLNATTEQAAEDARREAENDQNKTLLSHAYLGSATSGNDAPADTNDSGHDFIGSAPAPGSVSVNSTPMPEAGLLHGAYEAEPEATPSSLPPLESVTPTMPTPAPADLGLPLPPPVPDFSQLPPTPISAYAPVAGDAQPERLGDILAPEPAAVPSVPPVAPPSTMTPPAAEAPLPSQPASPNDPAQFKIPGQQ